MRLPIDGIQAFVQIAESGSFVKAAEKLCITQTALTRRIQRLEAFVGDKLLDRTTRTTALAPLGREFLPLANRLVEDLTAGLDRLRSTARNAVGDATVATIQSVATQQLPLALKTYARQFPENRVQILERSGALVTEMVRNGGADFGIHVQREAASDLSEEVLSRSPFMLVCHRSHRLAPSSEVAWSALEGAALITLGGASGNRIATESQLAKAGLASRGRFVAESVPTALALARANVGAAILPRLAQAWITGTGLVQIPLVGPVVHRSLSLVTRRNETLSPAAFALYDLLKKQFSAEAPTKARRA